MTLVIGVDSSTTATKAVVWDAQGHAVSEGRAGFSLSIPRPDWHEQDPEDWWRSTRDAIRAAVSTVDVSQVRALCLTHQRETFACLDADGRALRPAIVWMDMRSIEQVDRFGSAEIHRTTGKPVDTTPSYYKLLWIAEHEPQVLARSAYVVDVHAFLVHRLTGAMRTTTACADPLGLVDMERLDWSDELLATIGLSRAQMPELVAPGAPIGELLPDVAADLGLPAGLLVVGGAGDGQSAALGANATGDSTAYINLGTAVVAGSVSTDYLWDKAFRTLVGAEPGTFLLETLMQGGTFTVNWFLERIARLGMRDLAVGVDDVEVLEVAAAKLPAGAEGLLLLPYWASAQTPYWDPTARGMMFGLAGHHGLGHMFRAILEGIAFEQRHSFEAMEARTGTRIDTLLLTGGGARSALWRQILADVTKKTIVVCRESETTSLGAGIHAAAAAGLYPTLREAADGMTGRAGSLEPGDAAAARYDRIYDVYEQLYPATRTLHRALWEATTG